jgi:hypothetical protein
VSTLARGLGVFGIRVMLTKEGFGKAYPLYAKPRHAA